MHDHFRPFSDEVYHGERVALIGPNGTGKTHLLKVLSQEMSPTTGEVRFGPRTSVGVFTQINDRPDFSAASASTSCTTASATRNTR